MKKFILMCSVLLSAFVMVTSCKDDPVTPSTVDVAYFNVAEGSKWIYSNYRLLPTTDGYSEELLGENDTLTQGAKKIVLEKNATMMRHRFFNPLLSQASTIANYTVYEDEAENKVFVNSDFMKIFIPEVLQTYMDIAFDTDKWFLLADGKAVKEWVLDSFALTDTDLSLGEESISLNGHLKFAVKRAKDTTIASANTKAHTYTMSAFFEGKLNYPSLPFISSFAVKVEFCKINFYFGSQKGLLGIFSPANDVVLVTDDPVGKALLATAGFPNGYPIPMPINVNGFDKRLINIDVK